MKNAALYFFGVSFLVFGAGLFALAGAISGGLADAKYVISKAPVVLDQIKVMKTDVDATVAKAEEAVARVKAALPAVIPAAGASIGEAGANAVTSFSDKMSTVQGARERFFGKKDDAGPDQKTN
ncbi:hypothetical protein G6L37_03770 [Agrobacterium rubi]|nr:hypothetical protein [Agrobacterium rubi]NTF24467.1 hypothetical protein [Agrobacterium rubi]